MTSCSIRGSVYRWGRLCCGGFCDSLVLPLKREWWPTIIEFQSCGSITNSSGNRPLHFSKKNNDDDDHNIDDCDNLDDDDNNDEDSNSSSDDKDDDDNNNDCDDDEDY